ncbi:MAG: response regulator [Nitrospirae bacterium]|nr:response regulator [Nitrospirota bacterium]MBI5694351.1 response regulator [Nitrospirota bacterium]
MKKKILLVDNVESILDRQKSLLNRDTFHVFMAKTSEEALEIHRKEHVDVIIADLHMPGMPGDELCRVVRDNSELKNVSVLIATIGEGEADLARCRMSGANGYIKKPINKDDLSEKLANLLNVSTRQSIRILVKVKLDARIGTDFFIATTVDVSTTGLLFESEREFKVGDFLETSFFLPGSDGFKRVVSRSEVMRAAPGEENNKRYGVRFVEFKEGGSDMIADFVAKKTGKA